MTVAWQAVRANCFPGTVRTCLTCGGRAMIRRDGVDARFCGSCWAAFYESLAAWIDTGQPVSDVPVSASELRDLLAAAPMNHAPDCIVWIVRVEDYPTHACSCGVGEWCRRRTEALRRRAS